MTLTVTTDDQGNSPAPALNDVDTVTLNVTAVNDAPTGTDATVATAEDTAYTITLADFGFADPSDVPANALLACPRSVGSDDSAGRLRVPTRRAPRVLLIPDQPSALTRRCLLQLGGLGAFGLSLPGLLRAGDRAPRTPVR